MNMIGSLTVVLLGKAKAKLAAVMAAAGGRAAKQVGRTLCLSSLSRPQYQQNCAGSDDRTG